MERLTIKTDDGYQLSDEFDYGGKHMVGYTMAGECENEEYDEYPDYGVIFNKLGKIEDIMELHHIESPEELDEYLEDTEKANKVIAKVIKENQVLEKALELTCKYKIPENGGIKIMFYDTGIQVDTWQELRKYAIEQAKKEKEKNNGKNN